jgi:DNA-binding NtrC family response regulator
MLEVLFVDDEPCVLEALRDLLYRQRHAWSMHFAANGRDALRQLASSPADVVVTDLRMPHMNGLALLEELSIRYPQTVRILLTGTPSPMSSPAARAAHEVLAKPCDPNALVRAISAR